MKARNVLTILLFPLVIVIGAIGVFFYTTGEILEYWKAKRQ